MIGTKNFFETKFSIYFDGQKTKRDKKIISIKKL